MYLTVKNLSCTRNQKTLFQHLNFEVHKGEALHICGPNGSGKTSLLKILAHLLTPTEGEVIWQKEKDLLYIGHELGVKKALTVKENFKFIQNLNPSKPIDLNPIMDELNLTRYQDILCYSLSAGLRQRVALARLQILKANTWILDEPFTALDQKTIQLIQQWFCQHIANDGLLILTSHQKFSLAGRKIKQLELGNENGYCFV